MVRILKSQWGTCILILVLVCAIFVAAGDVVVKEGTIEGELFKSTGCTVNGAKGIAFGYQTIAEGDFSTATGYGTTANGDFSTAMGVGTTASGTVSTAMGNGSSASGRNSTAIGYSTEATAYYATAIGKYSTNNVANSFTVGYGSGILNRKVDFRVEHQAQQDAVVTVGDITNHTGDLKVGGYGWAVDWLKWPCCFYDKDTYGKALDYVEDCSKIIKVNAQGQKIYNHEADPEFLKSWITLTDYDKYTDTKVWNEQSQEYEPERIYQTHQELGTSLGMEVEWLRQCVYELKQENEGLKAELVAIKAKLGME